MGRFEVGVGFLSFACALVGSLLLVIGASASAMIVEIET